MAETARAQRKGWWIWVLVGGLMLIGGIVALADPLAATLTAEQIAAWVILAAGVIQVVGLVRSGTWSTRLWTGVLAAAYLWLGLSLLLNPLAGVVALTVLVAAGFLVSGVAKLAFALRVRGTPLFWPFLLSALMSVILALMVFFNFPQAAAALLGVMLATELVVSGATIVGFALWLRRIAPA